MVLVLIKIDKGKGTIYQEIFLHDFLCELTGDCISELKKKIRGKYHYQR